MNVFLQTICKDSGSKPFTDPRSRTYWLRVVTVEGVCEILTFASIVDARESGMAGPFYQTAMQYATFGLIFDAISWPFGVYYVLREPPEGADKISFMVVSR